MTNLLNISVIPFLASRLGPDPTELLWDWRLPLIEYGARNWLSRLWRRVRARFVPLPVQLVTWQFSSSNSADWEYLVFVGESFFVLHYDGDGWDETTPEVQKMEDIDAYMWLWEEGLEFGPDGNLQPIEPEADPLDENISLAA